MNRFIRLTTITLGLVLACFQLSEAQSAAFHYGFATKKTSPVIVAAERQIPDFLRSGLTLDFVGFAGIVPNRSTDALGGFGGTVSFPIGVGADAFAGLAWQFQESEPGGLGALFGGRFRAGTGAFYAGMTPRGAVGLGFTGRF